MVAGLERDDLHAKGYWRLPVRRSITNVGFGGLVSEWKLGELSCTRRVGL